METNQPLEVVRGRTLVSLTDGELYNLRQSLAKEQKEYEDSKIFEDDDQVLTDIGEKLDALKPDIAKLDAEYDRRHAEGKRDAKLDAEYDRRHAEGKREEFQVVLHVGEYDLQELIERAVAVRIDNSVGRLIDTAVQKAVDAAVQKCLTDSIKTGVEQEVEIFDFNGDVKERTSLKKKIVGTIAEITSKGLDYPIKKGQYSGDNKTLRQLIVDEVSGLINQDLAKLRTEIKKEFVDRGATDLIRKVAAEIVK